MATGFDARQGARQSFAFQGSAPVQSRQVQQGGSRGIQVVGGESTGQGVASGPQTDPGAVGAGLGQYFEQLMQPYLQRRQTEQFNQGFANARRGVALEEISHPNNPLTKIFGPTGYEQGAQFYAGRTAVADYARDQLANIDELKKMDPKELDKHLADASEKALTGDPYADQIINKGLFDSNGPLIDTVAKARYEWQQTTLREGMSTAARSEATNLQTLVVTQMKLGADDPNLKAGASAVHQSLGTFTSGLQQPAGMTDGSYQQFLLSTAKDAIQSGNGYAVEAMKQQGFWRLLSPEAQDKLDAQYEAGGARANLKAREDPDIAAMLLDHDSKVELGRFTPAEAAANLAKIDDKIASRSGFFGVRSFNADDQRKEAHTVTTAVVAAATKADDRAYERALRNEDWAHDAEVKQAEEDRKTNLAKTVWQSGNAVQGIAGGADKDLIEAQANNDWQTGNLGPIVRQFNGGYVSASVKASAQAGVEASVGEQFNPEFKRTYLKWKALYSVKPAAALSFYGAYHSVMQRFDSLVGSGTDASTAFSKTFGDPQQYGTADVPPERRKELTKNIDGAISAERTWLPGGRSNLGKLGEGVLTKVVWRHVVSAGTNSPIPTAQLVSEAREAAEKSGEYERYGQFAWANKAGTQPLGQLLHLHERDADAVFRNTYNEHMKLVGAPLDAEPSSIIRVDNNGHPAIIAVVKNNRGNTVSVAIPYADLAKSAHDRVDERVARQSAPIKTDPTTRTGLSAMR